jgi:hypothetical protein
MPCESTQTAQAQSRPLPVASTPHIEGRTVLRPHLLPVVDAHDGDVGVPQLFLYFDDVCFVLQRIGGGGRAQGVRLEAGQYLVDSLEYLHGALPLGKMATLNTLRRLS